MKKIIFALFFCNLFCIAAFSQEAVKVDEFDNPSCEDYLVRMDNIGIASVDEPTAKVYVFVYEGRELVFNARKKDFQLLLPTYGQAKSKIKSMKERLSFFRGYSIKNFVFIKGGFRENLAVEFWIVPKGANPPKPSPTLAKMKYRKGKSLGFCLGCC